MKMNIYYRVEQAFQDPDCDDHLYFGKMLVYMLLIHYYSCSCARPYIMGYKCRIIIPHDSSHLNSAYTSTSSTMPDTTVYLITGANRGIGFSIVKALASDPANIVFAGARTPAKADALHDLAKTSQAKINVIELVSADTESNKKAAEEVKKTAGRVDVIIANAGISDPDAIGPLLESDLAQWTAHYNINVVGVVVLYKEFYSLLRASTVAPKFAIVSSAAGSIESAFQYDMPIGVYGASKAAANYVAVKIHLENKESGLIAFPLSPGMVSSDMGTASVKKLFPEGQENTLAAVTITPDESANYIIKLVKEATRATHGGKLLNYDGTVLPW